ncbi:MAG: hypothetical protein ACKOCB_06725 [Planctomycetia bacterium]
MKQLTALEDAALRFILGTLHESNGWLDLTRICSRTGRHLGDVRDAVARLVRRRLVQVDESAPSTERWLRFVTPGAEVTAAGSPPRA